MGSQNEGDLGDFSPSDAFDLTIIDYNNNFTPLAYFRFSLTVGGVTWSWNCDSAQCWGVGTASITGGKVTGQILSNSVVFSGVIGGGTFQDFEYIDLNNGYTDDDQVYRYPFAGSWTNGWFTGGGAATADVPSRLRQESEYELTTYTPESGTMALAGSALVMAYIRRKCRC
jgi:hypothetical protein